MMVIQFRLVAGLILGGLAGLIMSKGYGIAGYIVVGIIGGLMGGSLASILFVVSGAINSTSIIPTLFAFAFAGAAILLLIKRAASQPRKT